MDSFNSYKDSYMNNLNNYKENINSYRNEAFEQAKDMGSQWVNQTMSYSGQEVLMNVWGYWSDLSNCKNSYMDNLSNYKNSYVDSFNNYRNSCMDSFNSYKDSYMNNLNNYKENINSYRNEAFVQAKDMGSQWVNQAKQRLEGQAEVVRDQVEQLGQLLLEKEFTQQSLIKFCNISQNICDTIHKIELENNTNTLARYLNSPQLKVLLQLVKH